MLFVKNCIYFVSFSVERLRNSNLYSDVNDRDLFKMLANDNEQAFVEIYDRYKAVLFLHARRMLNEDEQARDFVQEIFTSLWLKRKEIQINTSLKSYLFTTIKHKILNLILHQKHVEKHLNSMLDVYKSGDFSTDSIVRERELARLIEAEIQALPARMREVFVLSRKEYLSNREIAQRMDISEETVKKQISYALKILRGKLKAIAFLLVYLN